MAEDQTSVGAVKSGRYAAVVEELRKRFDYATDQWRDIRQEGDTDVDYVSGDPWDPTDRQVREDAGRPVMSFDEFGQYVNQLINTIRLHKRAIHVTPIGNGANDKTAQFRADLIRQIEYRSNAQVAYTTAFENTVQRSYGFYRIKSQFVTQPQQSGGDGSGFNQELLIVPCPNPNLITPDPDILSPTGADMRYLFQAESWALSDYRKKFPKAKIQDFAPELSKEAPAWIDQDRIQLAEYWTVEDQARKLLLFRAAVQPDPAKPPRDVEVFEDEYDDKDSEWSRLLKGRKPDLEREVVTPKVMQYLTNGFEILGTPTEWPGKYIPFVCCFGKILYVTEGGKSTKRIMSLVRLARDPAMFYSYIRTCQAEIVGGVPRSSWVGYEGQFTGHEVEWQKSAHEPVVFLEAKALTEATGPAVLPLPVRQAWDPQVHNLEVIAEAARRAVQAAMGTTPLPSSAQRKNEKSGVALQEIRAAEQQGSFHFVDAYEMAITHGGVILDDLLDHYYDTARDVTTRTQADQTRVVRINDTTGTLPPGQDEPIETGKGQHDITLSTGPASDSERQTANEFADAMVENIPTIAPIVGPKVAAKLMALSIRLKNIGPLGDEMADMIDPTPPEDGKPDPEQLQQQLEQMKAQLEEAAQIIAKDQVKVEGELKKVEIQEIFESKRQQAKGELELKKAELESASQFALEKMKVVADLLKTRATLEVKQTEMKLDAAIGELDRDVEMAGADAERQDAKDEAERSRAHEADMAERAAERPQADA